MTINIKGKFGTFDLVSLLLSCRGTILYLVKNKKNQKHSETIKMLLEVKKIKLTMGFFHPFLRVLYIYILTYQIMGNLVFVQV